MRRKMRKKIDNLKNSEKIALILLHFLATSTECSAGSNDHFVVGAGGFHL
jgi:hypothetical protein